MAGYDDISYAQYSTPRLTTIKQDVQKKAQKAVEILLKWIEEGEEYPQREVELPVTLMKRKSVEKNLKKHCSCEDKAVTDALNPSVT